jgi:hypothetical protein
VWLAGSADVAPISPHAEVPAPLQASKHAPQTQAFDFPPPPMFVIPNARPIMGDLEPSSIIAAQVGFHVSPSAFASAKARLAWNDGTTRHPTNSLDWFL